MGEDRVFAPPFMPLGGRRIVLWETDVAHLVPDHYETAGVEIGQRTNKHRIDGAKHRGVYADAERQRGDCDARERRVAAELAQSVADIERELLQSHPAPRLANLLFHEHCIAECPPSAMLPGLLRLEVQVILDLPFEVAFPLRPRPWPRVFDTRPNAHVNTPLRQALPAGGAQPVILELAFPVATSVWVSDPPTRNLTCQDH